MRMVVISDTHNRHRLLTIPDGDLLVHCGDITMRGKLKSLRQFNEWLGTLPHRHKIVIAGNHDRCFEDLPERARATITEAHYLQDEALEIGGIKFYGSPWQPEFHSWAFNLPRGEALAQKWAMIPEETDVLITHGPPQGVLDRVSSGEHAGCEALRAAIERVRPAYHLFGHIHEASGVAERNGTVFVNASVVNAQYRVDVSPDLLTPAAVFDLAPTRPDAREAS